jgi:hypothetical protein
MRNMDDIAQLQQDIRTWRELFKKRDTDNELLQDKMTYIQNEVVSFLRNKAKLPEKKIQTVIDIFEIKKFDRQMSRNYKRVPQFTANGIKDKNNKNQTKLKIE